MLLNILVIAALIALDQATKYLATMYLAPVGTMPLIPGVMQLQYCLNDGAAFSILSGVSWGQALLLVITGVVLVAMTVYLFWKKPASRLMRAALLLVISGGFGNFIDRALNGVVVDFFSPTFINFAIFNVADVFVCTGVGLLLLSVVLDEVSAHQKAGQSDEKTMNQLGGQPSEAEMPGQGASELAQTQMSAHQQPDSAAKSKSGAQENT